MRDPEPSLLLPLEYNKNIKFIFILLWQQKNERKKEHKTKGKTIYKNFVAFKKEKQCEWEWERDTNVPPKTTSWKLKTFLVVKMIMFFLYFLFFPFFLLFLCIYSKGTNSLLSMYLKKFFFPTIKTKINSWIKEQILIFKLI